MTTKVVVILRSLIIKMLAKGCNSLTVDSKRLQEEAAEGDFSTYVSNYACNLLEFYFLVNAWV